MPIYHFTCGSCGKARRRSLGAKESRTGLSCDCGGTLSRTPAPPTSNTVEVLDNGVMVKALERPAQAERLYKEHVRDQEKAKATAEGNGDSNV